MSISSSSEYLIVGAGVDVPRTAQHLALGPKSRGLDAIVGGIWVEKSATGVRAIGIAFGDVRCSSIGTARLVTQDIVGETTEFKEPSGFPRIAENDFTPLAKALSPGVE